MLHALYRLPTKFTSGIRCHTYFPGQFLRHVSTSTRQCDYIRQASASSYGFDDTVITGTAPFHKFLLVLLTKKTPSSFPPRLEMESLLLSDMQKKVKKMGGITNFAYEPPTGSSGPGADGEDWHNIQQRFPATLYMEGVPHPIDVGEVTTATDLEALLDKGRAAAMGNALPRVPPIDFYVCTHGSRDCRCGDIGWEVVQRLREEVARLPGPVEQNGAGLPRIRIREIAHVGGHKFAANVLVYPQGEWYGNLRPNDVPAFLQAHLPPTSQRLSLPTFEKWKFWRGQMGLSSEEQISLQNQHSSAADTTLKPMPRGEQDSAGSSKSREIKFITWEGKGVTVEAKDGESLMEVAKRNDLPGIEGVCEGKLECATCHVYLPSTASGEVPPVPAISEAEEDMLDYAISRKEASRLGCQIKVTPELSDWIYKGGQVHLPRF